MVVRRFPSRQDAESENPLERLSSDMARCGALQMCRISNRDAAGTRFDQAMRESGRRV